MTRQASGKERQNMARTGADSYGIVTEREAIVKWLRGQHDYLLARADQYTYSHRADDLMAAATYGGIADHIERGDHLKEQGE
jgi:hypothetical protein